MIENIDLFIEFYFAIIDYLLGKVRFYFDLWSEIRLKITIKTFNY